MRCLQSLILAGGFSRRMGSSKALLQFGRKKLIERQVSLAQNFAEQITIVSNKHDLEELTKLFLADERVQVILDHPFYTGQGPLAGIYTGMSKHLEKSHANTEWCLVLACDLINLNHTFLQCLIDYAYHEVNVKKSNYQAFIPLQQGQLQPLVALYSYQAIKSLKQTLDNGQKKVLEWISKIQVCTIDEAIWESWTECKDPFFNMNTKEEYDAVFKREEDDSCC